RATVAPELPGAEAFARACRSRGIGCNAGHSHATFEQVEAALAWGVSHVDHLFCAMSDRARLRQTQAYPMRGGLLAATLLFHRLTGVPLVEVICMATLTPARIAGWDREIGSIAIGKRADLLLLDDELRVKQVYLDGQRCRMS